MNRDIKTIYTAVTSAFLVAGAALLGGCDAEGQDGVPPPFASKAKVASKMVDREFDVQKKFDAVTKRYEKALDEFTAIEINMRMMPVSAIQPDAPRLSRKNVYESFLMAGANGVRLAEVYVQGRTRYPSCGYLVERLGNNTDPGEAAVEAACIRRNLK
ncbi:MAG: hypothetical protein JWO78_1911 [Micavibrio sp.]|nr:hypothetical protein [Micavibrio sp.]